MSTSSSILVFWIIYHWAGTHCQHTLTTVLHTLLIVDCLLKQILLHCSPTTSMNNSGDIGINQNLRSLDWNHISEQSSCCSYSQKDHTLHPHPPTHSSQYSFPRSWAQQMGSSQYSLSRTWYVLIDIYLSTVTQFLTSMIGWEQTQLLSAKLAIAQDEQPCQ